MFELEYGFVYIKWMNPVKFIRLERRKSQFELSLETRIPSYHLSNLENGKAEPSLEELQRLAEALGTTMDSLRKEISEEVVVGT
jgi:transcriptional regulator with XRE-family HTH domain